VSVCGCRIRCYVFLESAMKRHSLSRLLGHPSGDYAVESAIQPPDFVVGRSASVDAKLIDRTMDDFQ
jgi:hypothetical protein